MSRAWSGAAQSGSREYEPCDVERVLDALPRGRQAAMTLRTFTEMLGVEVRTVRAILSDRDGINYLQARDGDMSQVRGGQPIETTRQSWGAATSSLGQEAVPLYRLRADRRG